MSLAAVIQRSKTDREAWKYTNLAPYVAHSFSAAPEKIRDSGLIPSIVADAGERHQIVFENGIFNKERSKLDELKGILDGDAKKGYRLSLAGQTCLVTAPLELVFVTDGGDKAAEVNLKLAIELGGSCRLTLIEHHAKAAGTQVVGVYETMIALGPQAKLVHGRLISIGDSMSLLSRTNISIAEGAYYDSFNLVTGGKLVRNEIEAHLGKMAQCTLNGAMLLRGTTHADTTTHIIHEEPYGSSSEVYKSVVAEKARSVFQGKVTVAQDAQKTDAKQLSRALLLSDQAEADAKPELMIYADDVKCSHGSTIGAIDEDALFYLRARGLNENEARGLLIRAFINEVIDEIHVPEWRDYCRAEAARWCDEQ